MSKNSSSENENGARQVTFFTVIKSVLSAMIGIQSSKNRERDFSHGKPIHFIVAGLIGVAVFILLLVILVKFAMSLAG